METRSLRRIVCGKRAEYADWVSLELPKPSDLANPWARGWVRGSGRAQCMPYDGAAGSSSAVVSDRGMEGRCQSTRATE